MFKYHEVIKCLSINMKHILLNNLESIHSLVIRFGQFTLYYQRQIAIKKLCEKCGPESSSKLFLIFKESFTKRNLKRYVCLGQIMICPNMVQTNFDGFAITYLIYAGCFTSFIFRQRSSLILCKHRRVWNQFSCCSFHRIF